MLQVADKVGLKTLPRLSAQTQLQIEDQVIAVGYPVADTLFQSPGFGANLTGDVGVVSQPETTLPAIPGSQGVSTVGPYHDVILRRTRRSTQATPAGLWSTTTAGWLA